jgi:hypothetical protein
MRPRQSLSAPSLHKVSDGSVGLTVTAQVQTIDVSVEAEARIPAFSSGRSPRGPAKYRRGYPRHPPVEDLSDRLLGSLLSFQETPVRAP